MVRILVFFGLSLVIARAAGLQLTGHVRNDSDSPVAGARVTVRLASSPPAEPIEAQTDPAGAFSLSIPSAGDYLIDVEREGFFRLKDRPLHIEADQEVTLILNTLHEAFQTVDVNEQPSPVDIEQTRNEEHLTGTEVNDILYPNSHSLRNALRLMPGSVEDASGGFHFNGSSENQVQYLLNGFNITNPVSGQFNTTLAVEGIRSLDYSSGRYSPEFGKGSAGVLAINTEIGSDAFRYTTTDFIPGVSIQQGLRLGNWYPRLGVSGPIKRGRAWFSDTFDSQYTNALVTGLPAGQNTRSGWAGNNLLHVQVNLNPRNIFFADFLVNVSNQGRVGLGALDPVSTTQSLHSHEYFGSIKDQVYAGAGSLVELGYAHNEFFSTQTPQGQDLYVFSPQGRSGNYFITGRQNTSRDQALIHGYAPEFHLAGSHRIQAGVDTDFLNYNGDFHRTGYEVLGLANQLLSQTTFTGSGLFRVHDTEFAAWLLDTWRIAKRLQVDAGIRQDWDQRVANGGWSPRIAASWSPFASGRTRIAGGYAITYDAVALDPFGRTLDQSALTTAYNNGVATGPPALSTFTLGPSPLKLPRAANWSLSADHQVSARVYASIKYLRRRGTDGFDFLNTLAPDAPPSLLPLPSGAAPGVYQLANLRRDDFDSVQLSVRQAFSGQYEWMVSYTRSRAVSNAVLDANADLPLQILPSPVLPSMVPMPWDSPNRVIGWAYLPLPFRKTKNWSFAALADARSGFPFSVQDQSGVISGPVDSHRYPFNVELNLAIERIVTLHGYRFALRGGVNNLINSKNPTAVYNVIGSSQYLQFLGNEGRHYVVRIRFFGRARTK